MFGGRNHKFMASDLGLFDLWGHMWVAAEPKIAVSCRVYYYRPRFQAPPRLTFGLIDQGGRGQRPWIFGCGLQTCQAISQSPKKAMFPLSISFQKLHFLKTLHRILKDHFKINFLHCTYRPIWSLWQSIICDWISVTKKRVMAKIKGNIIFPNGSNFCQL